MARCGKRAGYKCVEQATLTCHQTPTSHTGFGGGSAALTRYIGRSTHPLKPLCLTQVLKHVGYVLHRSMLIFGGILVLGQKLAID